MADQRLIPAGIRDVSTLAMNSLIDRLGYVPLDQLLIYLVDNVTASALPHLAEQFSVTGYDGWALAQGETDRRNIIKRAIALHRRKGTLWAVRTAIESLGFAADVTEWFDYGGAPYCFRVAIAIPDGAATPANYLASIPGIIDEYKSFRSTCDAVSITVSQPAGGVYVASASVVGGIIITQPHP